MRQLKTMASLVVIFGVIMMGSLNASAAILMSDATGSTNPCSERKVDSGIIVNDKADNGIIVNDLAAVFGWGVISSIFGKTEVPTDCGIIVND